MPVDNAWVDATTTVPTNAQSIRLFDRTDVVSTLIVAAVVVAVVVPACCFILSLCLVLFPFCLSLCVWLIRFDLINVFPFLL